MNMLHLYGTVGFSGWGEDHFTSVAVIEWLAAQTGEITVHINSGGGDAAEGQAIYAALARYPGKVTVFVDSVAASAASLIAMAGDEIVMSLGSWMLIHDPATPWTEGRGDAADHARLAQHLELIASGYAAIYAERTGNSEAVCRELMRAETLLTADAAVQMGFATRIETAAVAEPVAAFDYRIYANVPKSAHDAADGLGAFKGKQAVLAMIAGKAGATHKETSPMNMRTNPASPEKKDGEGGSKIVMTARQVTRVYAAADMAKMPHDKAAALIESGLSLEMALEKITAYWAEQGDVDRPMHGAPTSRIGRDEGTTMRDGITEALVARMTGAREVTGPARHYMGMTFPEMAATFVGSRESVRTAGDRIRAIEMATHSRSDFPAIFENALNKSLLAVYSAAPVSYRSIAQRRDFRDFRPHPVVGVGDFPMLEQVGEGGEIKYGTTSESKETLALIAYAKAFRISRQMLVDDDLGAVERLLADRGRAVAAFEDKTFYQMALSGVNADGPTLLQTARQVFNTTDGTKAAAPGALNIANVGVAWSSVRKRKSLDGNDLELIPTVLLVGPDKELEAMQLVADISANESGKVNPYAGKLTVAVSAKIVGNAWHLFASPEAAPCFAYGYLEGESGPRLRMDEPFGQQGMAWSVELDFGCGAIDFRGGYKNAGA